MTKQLVECCCFSLKTGTIIIGVLGLITGLLMIGTAIKDPMPMEDVAQELVGMVESLSQVTNERDRTLEMIMKIVMACVEIIMSIVLIVGAVKGLPKLVYSWVVLNVVQNVLAFIVLFTLGLYMAVTGAVEAGVVVLIALVIVTVIQSYLIMVVNSFHTTILSPPTYEYTMTKKPILNA